MTAAAEGTEYAVVMELDDWLVIDATMDDELQLLAEEGWDFGEWGEASRDPYWAELSELGHSVRQAGWDQISDWPHDPDSVRQWATASAHRTETVRLTGRQWGPPAAHERRRRDRIDKSSITLRCHGEPYSTGVDRTRVLVLVRDLEIRVVDAATGEL